MKLKNNLLTSFKAVGKKIEDVFLQMKEAKKPCTRVSKRNRKLPSLLVLTNLSNFIFSP